MLCVFFLILMMYGCNSSNHSNDNIQTVKQFLITVDATGVVPVFGNLPTSSA